MSLLFKRIVILGVGLIGGSVALAIKKHQLCSTIVGYGRNESELIKAVELGVIDHYETTVTEAVSNADLVLLAAPMGAFETLFREMASALSPTAIITDVGSAKVSVLIAAKTAFGSLPMNLVPAHPIAGKEKSGVSAASACLFENRCTIVTPTDVSSATAIKKVNALWSAIGADVVNMTPERHDQVLAATSHLPHILAFSLVDTLSNMQEHSEIFRFSAGGFKDFTRIASSDPTMWRDICLHNKDAILAVLEQYETELTGLKQAIAAQDSEEIASVFRRAKQARDTHIN